MVEKWLPKIIIFSLLSGLLVASCLEPVDYGLLAKDDRVQDYIDSKRGLVIVINETMHELTREIGEKKPLVGGNKVITGLRADMYYMVEKEMDKEGKYNDKDGYPLYVTDRPGFGPGKLSALGNITYVEEKIINGLTNGHTYTVRDARPFESDKLLPYWCEDLEDFKGDAEIIEGRISIIGLLGEYFFMDFSDIIPSGYEYIEIPFGAERVTWEAKVFEDEPIKQGIDTVFDYVLVNPNDYRDFYFLTVNGVKAVGFQVIFEILSFEKYIELEEDPDDNSNHYNRRLNLSKFDPESLPQEIKITIKNDEIFDNTYKWYYNGDEMSGQTGPELTLTIENAPNDSYLQVGRHVFTVIATIGEIPYSTAFTLDIFYE
jgi:hypothetical protein